METGVTGCVSLTGQKPTLGTLTRAAEPQTPQTHDTGTKLETQELFCKPARHLKTYPDSVYQRHLVSG